MSKCSVNKNNEITHFWKESNTGTPSDALDCDTIKNIKAIGPPDNVTYLYKLVDGKVAPTEAGKEYVANQYQRDRAVSYPSWQEQMDLIYHSGLDGLKAELKKTKDKYPKE